MPGASADLVWLDRDPRSTPALELPALPVRATYLRGQSGLLGHELEEAAMTVPTNSSAANPLFEEEGHLQRALGLPSLVLFGLVYMVPLTVFTTYGIVTETTGGRLPLAYIVTLIAMVFTARVLRPDVGGLSGRRVGVHLHAEDASAPRSASWPAGRCCWTTCSCR